MSAITQLMTAEELLLLPRGEFRYELVKGELKKMLPAGFDHGAIIMNLAGPLNQHIKAERLGVVCGAETGFKLSSDPDTVRAPDIAFVRAERIPQEGRPKGFYVGAPDLAVEVLSPSDIVSQVDEKVDEWLPAGASAVWIVNPKRKSVTVYRAQNDAVILMENDELEGQDVVPGFRCRVAEIFV